MIAEIGDELVNESLYGKQMLNVLYCFVNVIKAHQLI